jgi:hypothetical protein
MAQLSPTPSKPPGSFLSVWEKWGGVFTKVLTILVIPLIGMVVTFYVRLSLAEERIAQLQAQRVEDTHRLHELGARLDSVNSSAVETNAQIREVRVLVQTIRESLRP